MCAHSADVDRVPAWEEGSDACELDEHSKMEVYLAASTRMKGCGTALWKGTSLVGNDGRTCSTMKDKQGGEEDEQQRTMKRQDACQARYSET